MYACRLMISKFSALPAVAEDLKRMMDSINEKVRLCWGTYSSGNSSNSGQECDIPRPVVSVGIASAKSRISMCYVEALYEEYQFRPPCGKISVRREHREMEALRTKEPAKGTKFVWQHTRLPLSLMQTFPDLTMSRLWQFFPCHIYDLIEHEFRENPFNEKLELPYNKSLGNCVLNFESGEMYSINEKKVYKIRCTTSNVENFLTCRVLGDSSYRSLKKHYQGAGILFYTFHPVIQEPVFLLGHMTYSTRSWCDFGGLKNFR